MESAKLIYQHFEEVISKYPKLRRPIEREDSWTIEGSIDVVDADGGYWDTYDVLILVPKEYPNDLPLLFESSKKIERHIDWHMVDNWCCVGTRAKMFREMADSITLLKWLDGYAHPFLANHVYKMKTGNYADQEFSHGADGIIEGWEEILGFKGKKKILEQLRLMAGFQELPRNRPCYCGSRKKYKRCFILKEAEHRMRIPLRQIGADITSIRRGLGKNL